MTQDQTPETNPQTDPHPLQGPVDTAQQIAQDIARQQNAEAGAPWGDEPQPKEGEATEGSYEDETKAELKDQLADRDLPTSGNKDDLVARLEEDDQAKT